MSTEYKPAETWYVLEADIIHGLLYRAKYGEEPDMLMLDLAAGCNTTTVEDDDGS